MAPIWILFEKWKKHHISRAASIIKICCLFYLFIIINLFSLSPLSSLLNMLLCGSHNHAGPITMRVPSTLTFYCTLRSYKCSAFKHDNPNFFVSPGGTLLSLLILFLSPLSAIKINSNFFFS
jgi:hypothetical protein